MGQCIYHQFSAYKTTWTFKCRNTDVLFTTEMVEEIKAQIRAYCDLRFTEEELNYLENVKWIKGSYVDFLRLWQPRYGDFEIGTDAACGLTIETKGSWLNTSMYEIPTLAIVNEVFFRMNYDYDRLYASFRERLASVRHLHLQDTEPGQRWCMTDMYWEEMHPVKSECISAEHPRILRNRSLKRAEFSMKSCLTTRAEMIILIIRSGIWYYLPQ